MDIIAKLKKFGVEVTAEMETAFTGDFLSEKEVDKKLSAAELDKGKAEADRDKYKGLYEDAEKTLKGMDGKDIEAITADRDKWKLEAEQVKKDYEARQEASEKERAIDKFVETLEFTSDFAKRAFKDDLIKADLPLRNGEIYGASDFTTKYDQSAFVDKDAAAKAAEAAKKRSGIVGRPIDSGNPGTGVTREQYLKMNLEERTQLKENDPDTYEKLRKG